MRVARSRPGPSRIVSRLGDHRVQESAIHRALHEDPAAGGAHLALVDENAEERAFDRRLEVGVGEENARRLAPELERQLLQRAGGRPHDLASGFRTAGERHLVDAWMRHEGRAGDASAGDDVDDAGRQPDLIQRRRQREDGQRSLLGRLEHDRAAGAERRRELPRRQQERKIPGNDLSGDANRLTKRQHEGVVGRRQHVALQLGGKPAVVLEARRRLRSRRLRLPRSVCRN